MARPGNRTHHRPAPPDPLGLSPLLLRIASIRLPHYEDGHAALAKRWIVPRHVQDSVKPGVIEPTCPLLRRPVVLASRDVASDPERANDGPISDVGQPQRSSKRKLRQGTFVDGLLS